MAWIDLEDGQVRTRNIELNEFTVRGAYSSHKSIKHGTSTTLIATVFSFCFFWSPLHGRFLTLYSSPLIILALHLLIIWDLTWVYVPLDTLFGFLWVVVVKAVLFKGLLHINTAKKVVAVHSMRW